VPSIAASPVRPAALPVDSAKRIPEEFMAAAAAKTQPQSDHDILTALNTDYINSVQNSDVKRFDEILSADFYCSNPDGSLLGRAAFLTQTAKPIAIKNLRAEDVLIRIMNDTAIIHARTRYTKPDGSEGGGRYTDVWMRQNGRWLAVSAHVTRL
jgi:ketosteroid isomerase-like protein